jgi:hypothetical protein
MLSILTAGMVAELVMLPALLAGPLGKVFPVPPPRRKPEDGELPPHDGSGAPHVEKPRSNEIESPPARKEPARALVDSSQPEHSAGLHQPHAFTLRDRLAGLRRSARDAGK